MNFCRKNWKIFLNDFILKSIKKLNFRAKKIFSFFWHISVFEKLNLGFFFHENWIVTKLYFKTYLNFWRKNWKIFLNDFILKSIKKIEFSCQKNSFFFVQFPYLKNWILNFENWIVTKLFLGIFEFLEPKLNNSCQKSWCRLKIEFTKHWKKLILTNFICIRKFKVIFWPF